MLDLIELRAILATPTCKLEIDWSSFKFYAEYNYDLTIFVMQMLAKLYFFCVAF